MTYQVGLSSNRVLGAAYPLSRPLEFNLPRPRALINAERLAHFLAKRSAVVEGTEAGAHSGKAFDVGHAQLLPWETSFVC